MNSSGLRSTVDEITAGCERFRILVLGNGGCGKSSLINKVFGVTLAEVSHKGPGHAKIDKELHHDSNSRFVLHDSEGFLPGETKELTEVQNFITQRTSDTLHIRDRLHALWICITTPVGNTRFTQTGVDTVFEMTRGKLPIIVVLTKYDDHVNSIIYREHDDTPESVCHSMALEILDGKKSQLPESCMLRAAPVVHVSIKPQYQETIQQLIQVTDTEIQKHQGVTSHTNPTSLVWAIAQRADPVTSIKASIDVGRAKYWSGLNAGTDLTGQLLQTCLTAIHNDIVTVWNIPDTNSYLRSDKFKALMSHLVDDLSSSQQTNNTQNSTPVLQMVFTYASTMTNPVSMAIATTGVVVGVAKWAYEVYQATPDNIARFMAYIVDLTAIMYRLCKSDKSSQDVDVLNILCEYMNSGALGHVHNAIRAFVRSQNVLRFVPGGHDSIFEEIQRLINTFCDERLPPQPQANGLIAPDVYHSVGDERSTPLPPSASQSLIKNSLPVSSMSRTLRDAQSDTLLSASTTVTPPPDQPITPHHVANPAESARHANPQTLRDAQSNTLLSASTTAAPPLDQPVTPHRVADPAAEPRSPSHSSNHQISPRRTVRQRIAVIGRAFARVFSFKSRKSRRRTARANSR